MLSTAAAAAIVSCKKIKTLSQLIIQSNQTKKDIEKLRESGMDVEISWTPGHADIKGNDQADKMAKEAAEEAKEKSESELPAAVTLCDVKAAAKESGLKKWQERWAKAETGRDLFEFRPRVDYKLKHSFESAGGDSGSDS